MAARQVCQVLYGIADWLWRGFFGFYLQRFCERTDTCLNVFEVTSRKLHHLAPLPTVTPESVGLCALGALGNLIRVTDCQ